MPNLEELMMAQDQTGMPGNPLEGMTEEQLLQIMEFEQKREEYPLEIFLEEEDQQRAVEIVMKDYDVADQARKHKDTKKNQLAASWEDKMEMILESWEGIRRPKTKPFTGCSNKTMRLTTAIEQTMYSQILGAVWAGGKVDFRPGERTDIENVRRTNKFMEHEAQTTLNLYDALDDYVHSCTKLGTGVFKYSWKIDEVYVPQQVMNPETGRPESVFMPTSKQHPQVIVVPIDALYFQPGSQKIEGPHPVIHKIDLPVTQVQEAIQKRSFLDKGEQLKNAVGTQMNTDDLGPLDKIHESAELRAKYDARMRNFPLQVLEWYGRLDVGDPRGPQECIVWIDGKTRTYLSGKLLRTLYPRNKRPFISRPCIKRGSSIFGVGYVELTKPLADEIDALYNQSNDSNTLDVMPSGFYHPTSGFDPDKVELGPNTWLPVENPVQNVYMPVRSHNTEKFVMMIRNVMEFVERLTAASSYLMGKEDELKGGTGSATRTNHIVAHAEIRLGPIMRRIASGYTELLTELYYLYYFYAAPGYAERLIGENGEQLFPGMSMRDNFLMQADAYATPDLNAGSKDAQRELAMWVYSTFSQHPLVLADPGRLWEVANEVLVSSGHPDPLRIIGPKPGSNFDQELINMENTALIQGKPVPVNPTDIDMQHLQGHMLVLQSRDLPEQIKQLITMHITAHQQKLEAIMKQALGVQGEDGNEQPAAERRVSA
jgi:hypothetical protein